jgi:predicted DNA-binding transcriptional regulator
MVLGRTRIDKTTETAIRDILQSKAKTRIYIFLFRKNGARSEDIIKGTHLHPSTVRELLVQMHEQKLIVREKLKNDSIGKNPYFYRAIPPIKLLQRYAQEIEDKLNRIANLSHRARDKRDNHYVKIKIFEAGR